MAITSTNTPSKLRKRGDCLFFEKNGETISPWHDIPLFADSKKETVNIVVEIPQATNPKMEVNLAIYHNQTLPGYLVILPEMANIDRSPKTNSTTPSSRTFLKESRE